MRNALLGLVFLSLTACPSQTPPARAQEAANELNANQRFGRTELLAERVSEPLREKFFERRKTWGTRIQIADSEVLGFKMKGDDQAEFMLRVAWYKIDEGDLHATTVKQSWKDFRGAWKLVGEDRADGDLGLFGDGPAEPAPKSAPERAASNKARFAVVRLGSGDAPATSEESPPAEPAKTDSEPAKSSDPAKADTAQPATQQPAESAAKP
jgi:hypothetical protein